MKKKVFSLMMTLLLAFVGIARADELTVNDGTTTNGYVPVYGFYADAYNKCEFVQPAADLADMNGATINGVTFYASQSSVSWGSANFQVFLSEVGSTSISAFNGPGTVVYEGALSISGGTMTVNFSTPYTYNGGNLLVGVYQTATGSYVSSNWYGVSATGASGSGYSYSGLSSCSFGQKNFLPKMTFVYEAAATGGCETPTSIAVSDITPDGATVAWEGEGSAWNLRYKASTDADFTLVEGLTAQTYSLNRLASNTSYSVGVQTVCGSSTSSFKSTTFTTANPCAAPTNLVVDNITNSSATLSWTPGYQETEWTVKYKKSADAWDNAETITAASPTITLAGLEDFTSYNVRVYNCENYTSANFTTLEGPCPDGMVCIGAGTATNSYLPTYTFYNYSLTQQIYTAAEIGQAGAILSVAFYKSGTSGGTRNLSFYMVSTNKNSFESATDWITVTASDLVYSGQVNFSNDAWTTIDLDTPFIYDGTSNVALIVDDNTGSYVSAPNFLVFDANSQALRIYSDGTNYDPMAPTSYTGTVMNQKNRIRLVVGEPPACPKPLGLTVANVTAHEADLTWTSESDSWLVEFDTDANFTHPLYENVEGEPTLHFQGMDPETTYYVHIKANCTGSTSDWSNSVSFTTGIACPAPTGLAVSNITNKGATLNWTSEASEWVVAYKASTDTVFTEISVTEKPYTFNTLAAQTQYTVKVKAVCGGIDGESQWSSTKSFTTLTACPAPTNLAASNVTTSSATLSWFEGGDATAWVVAYKVSTDTVFTEVPVTENPYTLNDLIASTTYNVKVRPSCNEEAWASITFMTADICPEGMVCIGTGTSNNQYVPTYTLYNYSLTQQIYTAAEIGQSGEITSVDFYKNGTNGGARTLDIYMVSTDKETFSGATDWIAVTASDLVYSGSVTFQNDAWTTIEFNTPFLYDGTTNIALIVDDNTGSWVSSPSFYAFNATSQAIRVYSDDTNYNATAPSSYSGTVLNVKNRVRFAISEPPACPRPTGLAVNYTGGITATVTWEGDATSYNIDVNGTVTEGVTSPYTLEGLELATTYAVMVQANCGEDQSEWAGPVSFTTDLCLPENRCEITFALTDSYGDGWNGAYIEVIDVATNTSLAQMSNQNVAKGDPETETYTLAVCDGRAIQFVWHSGSFDSECSYVVTDLNGEEIFSGSGAMSAPVNYTVNCTVITCKAPKNLVASDIDKTSVVLSWTPGSEDQSAWRIAYMSENDSTYNYKNVTSTSYTLNGLTPETSYTVKVQANCGDGDYSNWSDEISFTTADACPMTTIEGFAASFITTNQAVLNWASTYDSYQVQIREYEGEMDWSEVEILSTNSSSIALSGLEPGTEYEYQVRGRCSDVGAYTVWVAGTNFSTASVCSAPENLYVVPSTESAALSWTGYQEYYTVAWGETVVNNVQGTNYSLTDLQPSTTYTVSVKGEGNCEQAEWASIEFTTGTDWNNGSAWVGGVAPEPEGVGTVADSTIVVIPEGQGTVTFDSLAVGEGSYIVIEPGVELIFGGEPIPVVISFDDEEEEPEPAKCREEQLPGGYKLIAPPTFITDPNTNERYLPVDTTHLMDNAVNDLYYFDVNFPAAEWRNYKLAENNFVNLYSGQGYLYYYETATGIWPGYAWPTAGASKEIALDYNADHAYFPGANLIGNPFIVKGYPNMPFYVLNKAGNEVIADTTHYVKAGKGFFVLATEPGQSCTVSTTAPATVQTLGITLRQDCSKIDVAAIHFNDTRDLAKFQLNPNHTKIYMPFEGKDYAILHGEALGEMPLNFEAEESGTYTLSFTSKEVSFSYLRLVDNLTGVETNLLVNPEYTFDARVNDYASRFRLVYATGSSIDGDNFSFINSNGNLCIYGIDGIATLQVMDVLGHIISSEKFSGSYEQKLNAAPGVYMLRLINGNDVKVQKIVVK